MPTEVRFHPGQLPSGRAANFTMFTFDQLDQMNPATLRNKCRDLVEKIGEESLPPMPVVKDEVIAWFIDVQCTVARAAGYPGATPRHLGVPDDWAPADVLSSNTAEYFGGDERLAASQKWALKGSGLTFDQLQPSHRGGLSFEEHSYVNQQEAAVGFQNSRLRNQGGSFAARGGFGGM